MLRSERNTDFLLHDYLDGNYDIFVDEHHNVVEEKGTLTDEQGHTHNGPFGASSDDRLDGQPGRETFSLTALPSPNSKTLTLTLPLREVSASLAKPPDYPHFHFLLTRDELPLPPTKPATLPLASAAIDGGMVEVNSVQALANMGYLVHLLVRPTSVSGRVWRTRGVKVKDETDVEMPASTDKTFFWKADGTPLKSGEQGQEIQASWGRHGTAGLKQPKTLQVSAHLVEQQRIPGTLIFHGLPIPASGQTVDTGLPSQTLGLPAPGKSPQFRVCQIGAFSPEHPLSSYLTQQIQNHKLTRGIAVVLEYAAVGGGDISRYGSDYGQFAAADDRGRSLRDGLSASFYYGDALQNTPAGDARLTLFLKTPAPDAHLFGIRMNVDLALLTGRETDVTLLPVPAPPSPLMPGAH